MISFKPIGNQLVIEMPEDKTMTKGGLYLPQIEEKVSKPVTGIVIAAGPGKRLSSGVVAPMTVKAGDKILFGKYTGSELELDEKLYYVMSEDDVMAVIEEGNSK